MESKHTVLIVDDIPENLLPADMPELEGYGGVGGH